VALYEHSSVARDLLRKILEQLGAEVISLGRTDLFTPIDTEAVMPDDVLQAKNGRKLINLTLSFLQMVMLIGHLLEMSLDNGCVAIWWVFFVLNFLRPML